jgi:hypothetical protein
MCFRNDNGGVAQLGARLNGIEKVWGSNPHTSIRFAPPSASPRRPSPCTGNGKDVSVHRFISDARAMVRSLHISYHSWFQAAAVVVTTILTCTMFGSISTAQRSPGASPSATASELLQGTPDVTIFVIPTSGDTARVALAFRTRVPHDRVRKEIAGLATNGWGVASDLGIEDYSIRPGDTAHAPVTTGAHFSLIKAPQVQNSAPVLLPYLQAFHDYGRVAVIFSLSELRPYNGVENFESEPLVVRRVPEENAYHYEAVIRDHNRRLPELPAGGLVGAAPNASTQEAPIPGAGPPRQSSVSLPLMLTLLVVGVLGGLAAYAWLIKRSSRAVPTRNARS